MINDNKKQFAQDVAMDESIGKKNAFRFSSKEENVFGTAIIADGKGGLTANQQILLERRGIDTELAQKMGWRNANKGGGKFIEIPYFKNGKEVNIKARTLDGEKKFFQKEGGLQCFYNVDILKEIKEEILIITEGELDCLIALQCGYKAVSVPNGAPANAAGDESSERYEYIYDIPKSISKIILAVDNDAPGINLLQDLALRLGRHRCLWVEYPEGCKDLNDVFLNHGKEGVDIVISACRFIKMEGLYLMSELPPLPDFPIKETGIDAINEYFKIRPGDLSIFTGIPGMGKTTVMNHICFNMAEKHNWNICFASFEQQPQTEHKKALRILKGGDIKEADKWIDKHFSFIVPNEETDQWFDILWLKELMAAAVTRYNAKMIVIDPWNELDHIYEKDLTLTQYVGRSIKELKRFARKYMIHLCIVAHPAKLKKDRDGKVPVPTPYDISDSSHFYNKPDQIVIIHKPDANEDKVLFRVAKSRYRALGKAGDVELSYNHQTRRVGNVADLF